MNRFGHIGDKVPARGSAFASFWKEELKKESVTIQQVITNNPHGITAETFKRDCFSRFKMIPKVKKEKKSYTMRLLEGLE